MAHRPVVADCSFRLHPKDFVEIQPGGTGVWKSSGAAGGWAKRRLWSGMSGLMRKALAAS